MNKENGFEHPLHAFLEAIGARLGESVELRRLSLFLIFGFFSLIFLVFGLELLLTEASSFSFWRITIDVCWEDMDCKR